MNIQNFSEKSVILTDISPYVYGTTRLGDESISFEDRVEIAKAAIDTKVWFHTSRLYGDALDVLRVAFETDRTKIPKLIIKLGGNTIDEFKTDIERNITSLGINSINIGQLCLGGELAQQFATGGECFYELEKILKEGQVGRLVLEVFPWSSDMAYTALKGGYTEGIVDGFVYYLNPLQRFVSNQLWELLSEKSEPVIALRTIAGGPVHQLRDVPGFAWKEYLQKRAFEIAPIFERSGIESWTEFCVKFAHSFSQVRATVGATARAEHLQEFLSTTEYIEPLPYDIVDAIVKLHYRWSNEFDMLAQPWSM